MVVEAIEDLFHPVLVYNNRKGQNAELLKRFNEPSWNNPVVRYLDANEKDLIQRKDGVWTTAGTVQRMVAALKVADREIPNYLLALTISEHTEMMETATFAMHCYWEGEAKLGSINGVNSTRSGWIDSLEVVTVKYDPGLVDYAKLVGTAQSFQCASKVFAHSPSQLELARKQVGKDAVEMKDESLVRDAKSSDQKYYLIQTPLRHLPLSETQATKINAALKSRHPVEPWLSPRQRKLLQRILAVTERNANALKSFQYPEKVSQLADYASKLAEKLDALEADSPKSKQGRGIN